MIAIHNILTESYLKEKFKSTTKHVWTNYKPETIGAISSALIAGPLAAIPGGIAGYYYKKSKQNNLNNNSNNKGASNG